MIKIIVAMDKNGLIGNQGDLPWRLPADLAHFKKVTMGYPILMGRKTWDSLPRKPLPGRRNWVLTRDASWKETGALPLTNTNHIREIFTFSNKPLFVIGGSDIFKMLIRYTKELYVTHIDYEFEGDTYFPDMDWENWECISSEDGIIDEKNPYPHKFCIYRRV